MHKKRIIAQSVSDRYIRMYGGRVFLHRAGRLGYQPHLLSSNGKIIARIKNV